MNAHLYFIAFFLTWLTCFSAVLHCLYANQTILKLNAFKLPVFATDHSKVVVLYCLFFVCLCSFLLKGIFTLIHCFHVCVVGFCTVITSWGRECWLPCFFSLFRNIYNICHYLFSLPLGAIGSLRFEPRHDKTNKMTVCPAKTQIEPGHLHYYLSPVTRKPVFGFFNQVRLKPACAVAEAR